jgi:hypothetical protein
MSAEDADRAAFDAVLLRAGLKVIPEEYERLVRNYPLIQSQLAALRIPEVRYGEPALMYSARAD